MKKKRLDHVSYIWIAASKLAAYTQTVLNLNILKVHLSESVLSLTAVLIAYLWVIKLILKIF